MKDLVTVYITTFNRLKKLKRALNSVMMQSYLNIEVIVSDDASSDGTKDFMLKYIKENPKCKYIRSEVSSGACIARNKAIDKATGIYITGLDDDDEFLEDRVELFINNWSEDYAFLCSNFIDVYNDGRENIFKGDKKDKIYSYKSLFKENVATNQIFTKVEYLKDIGGFNPDVKRLQDWDTWLRLSFEKGLFLFLEKPTYLMHHEISKNFVRVSTSYPIEKALYELIERNKDIYGDEYKKLKCYASYLNGNLTFTESLYWALSEYSIRNLLRYFKMKIMV